MSILHVPPEVKTKKHLHELTEVAETHTILFRDPSLFNPQDKWLHKLRVGEYITCTNHPKRSWFARVERISASGSRQFKVT